MSLPYNEKLIPLAKTLRKNQTKQEKHLWYDFLKDCPVRFQRQKTIQTVEKVGLPQKNYLSMKSAGEKPLSLVLPFRQYALNWHIGRKNASVAM